MNVKKYIIQGPKLPNFQKLPQTKNGKLYFSPTFQKVELRNSTFFQQTFTYPFIRFIINSFVHTYSLINLMWNCSKDISNTAVIIKGKVYDYGQSVLNNIHNVFFFHPNFRTDYTDHQQDMEWQEKMKDKIWEREMKRRGSRMGKSRITEAGYTATPVACGWAGAVLIQPLPTH